MDGTMGKVDQLLSNFEFGEAIKTIHDFFWGEFCDWYIEMSKVKLRDLDLSPLPTLVLVLKNSLLLLHPFMPFITERIWQELRKAVPGGFSSESIMIAEFPHPYGFFDPEIEERMDKLTKIVSEVRLVRHKLEVKPRDALPLTILSDDEDFFRQCSELIKALGKVDPLQVERRRAPVIEGSPVIDAGTQLEDEDKIQIYISPDTSIVVPKFINEERISKEIREISARILQMERELEDEVFTRKAPSEVVKREEERLDRLKHKLEALRANLTAS
jgi:valyl-tRNA synthetase